MEPVVASCHRGFLEPDCSRAGATFGFGLFTVFNIIVMALPKDNSYIRLGTLPLSFFVASMSKLLLTLVSLSLVFFVFYTNQYSHLIMGYIVLKTLFWLISFSLFVQKRDLEYLPASLAFSNSVAVLIQLIPFFNWHKFFNESSLHNGEMVIYFIELFLTLTTFVTTMVMDTRRTEASSGWSRLSRKVSLILPYIWPKKSFTLQFRVGLCFLLLVVGRVINVVIPLYNKWIVDALSLHGTFKYSLIIISTFLKFLQGNGAMGGFLNTLRTYMWIPIQQYTTRELEVELFSHLHSLSLRWHLSRKTGLVLRVMDRGTSSVNSILNYVLFNILPTIADIFIAVVFFFSTFNYYFGIIVFITMVLYLALTITITEWRTKIQRRMNEKDNATGAIGTDSLLNYETVKYYGNEEFEIQRFQKSIEEYQYAEWQSQASLALLNLSQNSIIGVGMMAGSLLIAFLIINEDQLTVGDYVMFTTYILQLYSPLNFFGTVYRMIQKAFVDMENMFDLLNEEVEVQDSPNAIEYRPEEGRITVKDVEFAYVEGRPVLRNVSFDVGSGETVALVGPSGSGKSTMIRLLFRLFEANQDSIEFDGKDIRQLKLKSLRKQIGIVPQDTVLFNDTIMYNIRFGNVNATDEEVMEAAKAAMIHDKILSLPLGYETIVGERGLKLSGGEKQRVAIARTILKKPQFIFLDEATSALDTATERAIQRCLEELCATRTSVVVAHRLSTVVNATKILVLDKGSIVESGSHSELLARKGVYFTMWQSQNNESSSSSEQEKLIDLDDSSSA